MRLPPARQEGSVLSQPTLHIPPHADDVRNATLRYLLYGLMPAWFVPALLDWIQHRRTAIEYTTGLRESLIHALMMIEIGGPLALAMLCEINPLVLTVILASIAAHEATALWDVSTAVRSGRTVTPWEQHVHSFLESLPFIGSAALACLHWSEVRRLVGRPRTPGAWRLRPKQNRLPLPYLTAVATGVAGLIALPYGEELVRCLRARRPPAVARA
jgi:hypothetical protein